VSDVTESATEENSTGYDGNDDDGDSTRCDLVSWALTCDNKNTAFHFQTFHTKTN